MKMKIAKVIINEGENGNNENENTNGWRINMASISNAERIMQYQPQQ